MQRPAYQLTGGGEINDVLSETYPLLLESIVARHERTARESSALVPWFLVSLDTSGRRDEDNTLLAICIQYELRSDPPVYDWRKSPSSSLIQIDRFTKR